MYTQKPRLLEYWGDQILAVCLYRTNLWCFNMSVSRMFLRREKKTGCPQKKSLHNNTASHTKNFFPHHTTCKSNVVRCHIQVVHTVKQAPRSVSCLQNHPWPAEAQTEIEYYFTIQNIIFRAFLKIHTIPEQLCLVCLAKWANHVWQWLRKLSRLGLVKKKQN